MTALRAILHREAQIRLTNLLFIFWDVLYPLGYLLVFGVGIDRALRFDSGAAAGSGYHAFFLAGVLGMASFGIASNTAWSFFMDRDNGVFFEMLTYPMSRAEYLLGKVLFNTLVALVQAAVTIGLAATVLGVRITWGLLPLAIAVVIVGTAGWFFFYAIFAIRVRQNDAFNSITSIFYFVFLFASSMFYPLDPMPQAFRIVAYANPVTWQVDLLRFATTGAGSVTGTTLALEAAAFAAFARVFLASFEPFSASWATVLWVLAVATMVVGTVVGVAQTNLKRMLAYSSIAHGGYLLVGLIAANQVGKAAILFYLLAYAVTNLAAFGVIALLGAKDKANDELRDFAGLWQSHPALAALMTVSLLSLGGGASVLGGWRYISGTKQQNGPPFKLLKDSGIPMGMSSDGMQISPMNPWLGLYYVVTGKNARGDLINEGQTLPRNDALRLYTAENGWFMHEENTLGTLEPGKYADLVVLSDDYFDAKAVPDEAIKKIHSLLTVVGGRVVFGDAKKL